MRYVPWWSPQPNCLVCPRGDRRYRDQWVRFVWIRRHCCVCPPVERPRDGVVTPSACLREIWSHSSWAPLRSPAILVISGVRWPRPAPLPRLGRSRTTVSRSILLRTCALTHSRSYYVITSSRVGGAGENRLHRLSGAAASPRRCSPRPRRIVPVVFASLIRMRQVPGAMSSSSGVPCYHILL